MQHIPLSKTYRYKTRLKKVVPIIKNLTMKKLPFFTLLVLLTISACRKDVEGVSTTETTPDPTITTIEDYEPKVLAVTGTLYGVILSEADEIIEGAMIQIGNNTTTSDGNGRFILKDIPMNQAGTLAKISKDGYFDNSYRFFPQENSVNYLKKTLLNRILVGNFAASDGALITSQEGIAIDFPANSIVDANGSIYEGTVEVAARWLDPTSPILGQIMPGSLDGLNNLIEEVSLFTAGMVQVELQTPNGAKLNLGNDKKATISAPIPDAILANAPATIPLWYFHEEYGIWIEDGMASLVGDQYVGEVSHFTYWNYDGSLPSINLSGTVVDANGNPIPNIHVWVEATSGWSIGHGNTDDNGFFSGPVTANQELIFKIYNNSSVCNSTIGTIGPFSEDTNLGNVVIPASLFEVQIPVTATLIDCNDNPVTSGFLEVTTNTGINDLYYTENGDISFTLFSCNNDITEINVLAYDLNGGETGELTTYPITNPLNLNDIAACGEVIENYINVYLDGNLYQPFSPPGISIGGFGTDSLGIQGFLNEKSVSMEFNGITTVGVYDNTNITSAFYNLENAAGQRLSNNCFSNCDYDNLEFTFIGDIGEDVEGYWEGTDIEFENFSTGNIEVYDIRVEFDVVRE